jgi:cobalamin biosynthesis Mg chelatase CobN
LTAIWSNTPDVLITGSGRLLMVLVTAAVIWPLCMVTNLRQVMQRSSINLLCLCKILVRANST